MKRHSHVSSGPPAIPEGRISRFRFWPWLFPRGLSEIGEAQALARIHPTHVGLPLDSSFPSWLLRLTPLAIRGPPSAQSSFACHKCDSWQGGVQHHLEERYLFFIAPTSSCAKPPSSSGLRVSTLISRGPGRLLRAPAGNWFFPTLSLQVFPRMLEPLIPSGGRVHLPVTSPNLVGLPQLPPMGRLPESPREETSCGGCCEIVAIPYVQASWFVRHPGLPYRCAVSPCTGQP
jgi:hypothetical protein